MRARVRSLLLARLPAEGARVCIGSARTPSPRERGEGWSEGLERYDSGGLRPEQREAFVRVEDVALDIVDNFRLALQRVHRAAEAHPVQELLLAGILDLLGAQLAPARELARAQFVEARPVAGIVGIEVMVFWRQEGVRPARRGDQRDPPWAVGQSLRHRAADIETAPRVG